MSSALRRWGSLLDAALGITAAVILFVLMAVTFVDVIGRYLFNHPLSGAFETTELLMLVLIFAGLPLVSRADEHVTMDFIDSLLGPRGLAAAMRLTHLVCAATMALLAWLVWVKAGRIASYGDTTDVLQITVAPFVYFMSLMIGLSGLVHLWNAFRPQAASSGAPSDGPAA